MSTLGQMHDNESAGYHHGNLHEALLVNGLQLLESTQGVEFSMRELTRMIGVSANAVYRHFASKEQLLTALAIHGFEQLLTAQAKAIQDATDPKDGYLNCGREYINFAIEHPSLFRLMYGRFAVQHSDKTLKSMSKLAYTGMLYAGAAAFNLSAEDPSAQTIAALAWSVVHGLSHLIIDGQFSHLSNEAQRLMIEQILLQSMSTVNSVATTK